MRTRQKGFTLLEMVVVVAVIGILLGIAIPSYQNYVIRSNRTEGQALLSDAAARQERYYSQNPGVGYTKDVAKLGMSSANSPNNLYNLTIATPTSTTYTLTATPINSQTRDKTCGKLTLNQAQPARPATTAPSTTAGAETKEPLYERGSFIAHGSQSLDPQFLGHREGNVLLPPLQFLLLRRPPLA